MFKNLIKRTAFTMAEILLSLTIIGVVAAITLPSLTGNINERTWNTQRKALYSRMSQAIALMPAINGYGTAQNGTWESNYSNRIDSTADLFLANGLSKVLKLNNICDNDHLQDCGFSNKIMGTAGSVAFASFPKTIFELTKAWDLNATGTTSIIGNFGYDMKAAAFETANGESVAVYYNPYCRTKNDFKQDSLIHKFMCVNFIYDLNGKKGPNTMGKDMGFMTLFYSVDSVLVAPVPLINKDTQKYTYVQAQQVCRAKEDSRLPNFEELGSLFFNKELMGTWTTYGNSFWSGTVASNGNRWHIDLSDGHVASYGDNASHSVRCVKRN